MSEEEEEVVKAAARISGATLVGVDHCLVDGEIYVLECNASPGVGANYHNYDIRTVPQKNKKVKGGNHRFFTPPHDSL